MNKLILTAAAALLCNLTAPVAAAEPAQPIELKGNVQLDKVVIENGHEKHVMVEPKVVVPGDKLVFATAYRNTGSTPVSNFVVTNPIPAGVALAQGDAPMAEVSVDGGKTWGKLASLTVTGTGGVKRAAQSGDVTHIRWTLATVAPGASGTLTYHAVVR
jgi:uncharacterized repeat protein (TIGR01451 family)